MKQISEILTLFAITNSFITSSSEVENFIPYIVEIDGDPEYKNYAINIVSQLPLSILRILNNKNEHVILLEDDNSAEFEYKKIFGHKVHTSIFGFTDSSELNSYVEACLHENYYEKYNSKEYGLSCDEFNKCIVRNILVHEIGHLVDGYNRFLLSRCSEFEETYAKEKKHFYKTKLFYIDNLGVEANISNEVEYFVSAFACFFVYPLDLLEYCPYTYNYIQKYLMYLDDLMIKRGYSI